MYFASSPATLGLQGALWSVEVYLPIGWGSANTCVYSWGIEGGGCSVVSFGSEGWALQAIDLFEHMQGYSLSWACPTLSWKFVLAAFLEIFPLLMYLRNFRECRISISLNHSLLNLGDLAHDTVHILLWSSFLVCCITNRLCPIYLLRHGRRSFFSEHCSSAATFAALSASSFLGSLCVLLTIWMLAWIFGFLCYLLVA